MYTPSRLPSAAPLWCRLFHNWKIYRHQPGYVRSVCRRCEKW